MSRIQTSGIVAIIILAAGIFVSPRLRVTTSQTWTRLQPPPATIGRWSGTDQKYADAVYKALPGAEILLRVYDDPTGLLRFSVTTISSPYLSNFHNPLYCYKGAGYSEESSEIVTMKSAQGGLTTTGSLIVMQNSQTGQKLLLFGWYALGKRSYVSAKDLKWQMSLERFLGGTRVPAYFVSVAAPLQDDKDRTTRQIERFVQDLLPYVRYEYAYAPYLDAEGNGLQHPGRSRDTEGED